MSALLRREQIIERMKVCKFDTAFNLAENFGVSWRTIIRDVQELTVNGYPIQAEIGRGGGIRWIGSKKQYPFTCIQLNALHDAIADASPENKLALESLLCDNTPPKANINSEGLFELLRNGQSQAAVAHELGISKSYFTRLLSGERKPSAKLEARILNYKREVN